MNAYALRILVLHLTIALIYLSITSYVFVISKQPNPVGTGLRQWFFMFMHLIITIIVFSILLAKATNKPLVKKKFLINCLIVISIIIVSTLFSNPFWEWLWALRGK
jgi:hypothetical protein